jgi:hypothetical protein
MCSKKRTPVRRKTDNGDCVGRKEKITVQLLPTMRQYGFLVIRLWHNPLPLKWSRGLPPTPLVIEL